MSNIQDIISKALAWWSKKHAASTVQCQGIYFSMLMETVQTELFIYTPNYAILR